MRLQLQALATRALLRLVAPGSILLCAILAATAVSNLVEAIYFQERIDAEPAEPAEPQPPTSTVITSPEVTAPLGDALVARNMFCPDCGTIDEPLPPEAGQSKHTSLPLRLVATNVATPLDLSFASIVNTHTQRQGAYRLGHRIPEAGIIEHIGDGYLDFRNESSMRLERLAFDGEPGIKDAPVAKTSPGPDGRRQPTDLVSEYVKKVSDSHFEIDRRLIGEVQGNPLLAGARVNPVMRQGQLDGAKVFAVRPRSVAHELGLRNGDQIVAVNGERLTSIDAAVALMGRLGEVDDWKLQIERRGQPVELSFRLR